MVHRRSTYKLAFKNISCKIRKSIWEENTVIRETRRKDEMSHHSIDESDLECECDKDENKDENQSEKDVKKQLTWSRNKENKPTPSIETRKGFLKKSGRDSYNLDNSKSDDDADSGIGGDKSSEGEKLHQSTSNLLPTSQRLTPKDSINYWQDTLNKGKRYASESNLLNAGAGNSSKINRGVLKFIPSTGEIDLIPAQLALLKRPAESKKEITNQGNLRSSSGFCNSNKGYINCPQNWVRRVDSLKNLSHCFPVPVPAPTQEALSFMWRFVLVLLFVFQVLLHPSYSVNKKTLLDQELNYSPYARNLDRKS